VASFTQRIRHGWNAFLGRDPTKIDSYGGSTYRPDRYYSIALNAKNLLNFIYNRIAVDTAQINFRHIKVDSDERYLKTMNTHLNECLSLNANLDQTGRSLIQDTVISMFIEGCVAIVPVDIDVDTSPENSSAYDILSMRTGRILEWYPDSIKVHLYNERDGKYHDIVVKKSIAAIIENPFYYIMNEPNSTLQQLLAAIARLNRANAKAGDDKLNLIIQLPYSLKNEVRQAQAKERERQIERQLENSKYGIAYIDSTEHVTQLNRALENNLWDQVQSLTTKLYSELGFTPSLFDGTANDTALLSYRNSTLVPIANAITEEMTRKWISITAYTQGQRVTYFNDLFKLVPVDKVAEVANKLVDIAAMTSNEVRTILGMKPSDDPDADTLRNKKLSKSTAETEAEQNALVPEETEETEEGDENQNG
jgi:DNA-directed RNA polymerase subunit F